MIETRSGAINDDMKNNDWLNRSNCPILTLFSLVYHVLLLNPILSEPQTGKTKGQHLPLFLEYYLDEHKMTERKLIFVCISALTLFNPPRQPLLLLGTVN
jgi:hypothetical protein